jgi:FtsH-binding integral membrane protein
MEEKVNPWKSNLTNGLILGLVGIVYSLLMYFLNLSLNKSQSYIFMIIQIAVLYFLLKSYRDNFKHGQITFGQSVGAGVIINVYYAVIMAIFTYILYTMIDPGLIAKQLAMAEEGMVKKGLPQATIDAGMAFTAKIMKPGIMAFTSTIFIVIWGVIISMLVSIFIKKEGNPLIDTPVN